MSLISTRRIAAFVVGTVLAACSDVSMEPAAITISPSGATLFAAETLRFKATVTNADGDTIAAGVTWQSSDASILTIDSSGLATVHAVPAKDQSLNAVVSASVAGIARMASVVVAWRAPFDVWPDTNVLYVGMTRTLVPRLIPAMSCSACSSTADEPTSVSTWKSSDAAIAEVTSSGVVTAKAPGHVQIIATKGTQADTAELYVRTKPTPVLHFTEASGSAGVYGTVTGEPNTSPRGCGLTDTGDVYCWGFSVDGNGPTDRCESRARNGPSSFSLQRYRCSEIPLKLSSPVTFTTIAARGDLGCGVATSRKVYCWGSTGTVTAIASSDDFISVHLPAVGPALYQQGSVCALRIDRVLVCWGGAFGSTPTAVGTMAWRAFAGASGCGIGTDSVAYCITSSTTPQRVGTNSGWAAISTSGPAAYPTLSAAPSTPRAPCVIDFAGQAFCGGTATTAFAAVSDVPAVTAIDMFGIKASDQCGLSSSGDLHCFYEVATADKKIDLGAVKLKRFFGTCGISLDDKAYCWVKDPASGTVSFRKVPGQD